MLKLILHRGAISILLLLLVSAVTFVLQALIPGDLARALLGVDATEEQYRALREELKLDTPVYQRYIDYIAGIVQGDFGYSVYTGRAVADIIAQRLPVSLAVMVGALVIAVIVGVLLGVWSATRGQLVSKGVDALSMIGFALPSFWLALVLVSIFAVELPLFPATGYAPLADGIGTWAYFLVLPWLAMSIHAVALIAKVTRDSMMSVLNMDYIRTLRAAGIRRRSVIWKHGLRNAGIQVTTMVGLVAVSAMAGTVFVENVFALPGLGSLAVQSIHQHDALLTQGVVLTYAIVVVVINLLVDLVYGVINPRVRIS